MTQKISAAQLEKLRALDTPTVCNAIERVRPSRTGIGFTTLPLVCADTGLPPIVGFARTATIRAVQPPEWDNTTETQAFLDYYRHMAEPPHPTVSVIEDIDPTPGYGAWWGEVHSNMHKGLGSLGVITNGSIRDLDQVAEGFQMLAGSIGPSHAFNHCVEWNIPVTVAGMRVHPGDLIHADRHGAVVVPFDIIDAVPVAAADIAREEAVMIEAAKRPDFSIEVVEKLLKGSPH